MALEDEFGIQIPDGEAEKITTVQEAVDYVDRHLGGSAPESSKPDGAMASGADAETSQRMPIQHEGGQ
jgi:hypothetical protein